jgi:hypothetical protein
MRDTTNHGAPVPPSLVKEALLRLDPSPARTPAPEGETAKCCCPSSDAADCAYRRYGGWDSPWGPMEPCCCSCHEVDDDDE